MDDEFEKFIRIGLRVDHVDMLDMIKQSLLTSSSDYQRMVDSGFRELLHTRELTTSDWAKLTHVDFDDEDQMYQYLNEVYEYFFQNRNEPPTAPED